MSFLGIEGCEVYVKRLLLDKLSRYFYNRGENKVFITHDGVFLEKKFVSKIKSLSNLYLEEVRDEQQMDEANTLL